MRNHLIAYVLLLAASLGLASCSSMKNTSSDQKGSSLAAHKGPDTIKYSFYLRVDGSMSTQPDEIFVDTTGQMTYNTQQHMRTGQWKNPTGFAYLDKTDDDTLFSYINYNKLFDVSEEDVKPQCPNGDQLFLSIYRSDINKKISIHTNTCSEEFNLLSGDVRRAFQELVAFSMRLRDKYRPRFPEQ